MFLRTHYLIHHSVYPQTPACLFFSVFFYCFVLPHGRIERFTWPLSGSLTLEPPLVDLPSFITEAESQSWVLLALKWLLWSHPPYCRPQYSVCVPFLCASVFFCPVQTWGQNLCSQSACKAPHYLRYALPSSGLWSAHYSCSINACSMGLTHIEPHIWLICILPEFLFKNHFDFMIFINYRNWN